MPPNRTTPGAALHAVRGTTEADSDEIAAIVAAITSNAALPPAQLQPDVSRWRSAGRRYTLNGDTERRPRTRMP